MTYKLFMPTKEQAKDIQTNNIRKPLSNDFMNKLPKHLGEPHEKSNYYHTWYLKNGNHHLAIVKALHNSQLSMQYEKNDFDSVKKHFVDTRKELNIPKPTSHFMHKKFVHDHYHDAYADNIVEDSKRMKRLPAKTEDEFKDHYQPGVHHFKNHEGTKAIIHYQNGKVFADEKYKSNHADIFNHIFHKRRVSSNTNENILRNVQEILFETKYL